MNLLLKVYLVAGVAFFLSVYAIMLAVWFDASLNGVVNGAYVVSIYTDALGENDLVLVLLFAFLPVVTWVFTNTLRRVMRAEATA